MRGVAVRGSASRSLALVAAVACSGPLELANIQIGRSLNQDGSIASITTLFKPSETIYVAVQTGAGKGAIGVKWKFGDKVVAEPTKPVDTTTARRPPSSTCRTPVDSRRATTASTCSSTASRSGRALSRSMIKTSKPLGP